MSIALNAARASGQATPTDPPPPDAEGLPGNSDGVAKFEKTRAYRAAAAKKGLKTKEKKAAAEQEPTTPQSAQPDAPPTN